jgi:hypothetical protein
MERLVSSDCGAGHTGAGRAAKYRDGVNRGLDTSIQAVGECGAERAIYRSHGGVKLPRRVAIVPQSAPDRSRDM